MCTELPPQPSTTTADQQSAGGPVTRRTALLASAGLAGSAMLTVSGALPAAADGRETRHGRHGRLDLTYTLGEDFPAYTPGEEAVRRPGTTIPADGYYQQRWDIYEHTGTHVDLVDS